MTQSMSTLDFLNKKSILITGANGLIGSSLIERIYQYNLNSGNIHTIALVRDKNKLISMFPNFKELEIIEYEFASKKELPKIQCDYILHLASPTQSKFMVEKPVETIDSIVLGTKGILELAKRNKTINCLIASSMEVYGDIEETITIYENTYGRINQLQVRSSYPEAKRLVETMTISYANEYNFNTSIARISMCYGKTKNPDNRVLWDFIKKAKSGKNIELMTDGKSSSPITSLNDCIDALLLILENSKISTAYNIANENNYISIQQLAEKVANKFIGVKVEFKKSENSQYPNTRYLNLDSSKMQKLGWKPKESLDKILDDMIECI